MFHNSCITDWQGQVVWLIGAASAFDHALARELHARGAHVLLSAAEGGVRPGAAESQPGGIVPLPLDVRQRSALTAGCTRIVREHGRLDVVVRCAVPGSERPATAPQAAVLPEAVQHLLDTVVPLLRRQGHGHLSLVAHEDESRRGAVQGATRAMVEKLRAELPPGIGVSAIHAAVPDGAPAGSSGSSGAALGTRQAAERAVQGLAKGHSGIEAPQRATLWQRLRGRAGAAPEASGGVRG